MSTILSQLRAASSQETANCPLPPAPTGKSAGGVEPCNCGCVRFWRDAYGNVVCRSCRPPKGDYMVRESLLVVADPASLSGYKLVPADPVKAAALELAELPPPKLCRCGSNFFWLAGGDVRPRCHYCEPPQPNEIVRRRICARLSGGAAATSASPLYWDDADQPKLYTVWELASDEEKRYFEEVKEQARQRQEAAAAAALARRSEPAKSRGRGRKR